MKVIVAGSRGITDEQTVKEVICESPHNPFFGELVTGEAAGVDTIAKECFAHFNNVDYRGFPVSDEDYQKYGIHAYFRRNRQMAKYADGLIAIWDGHSPGTHNMIELAMDYRLDTYVKVVNPQDLTQH